MTGVSIPTTPKGTEPQLHNERHASCSRHEPLELEQVFSPPNLTQKNIYDGCCLLGIRLVATVCACSGILTACEMERLHGDGSFLCCDANDEGLEGARLKSSGYWGMACFEVL